MTQEPINVDELLERCMGNAQIALLLLDKFEAQLASDLSALTSQLGAGDTQQLARTAHALKGAAAAIAAGAVRDAAAEIDRLARTGEPQAIEGELGGLRQAAQRCVEELPALRNRLSGFQSNG